MPGGKELWERQVSENSVANVVSSFKESEDSRKAREFRHGQEIHRFLKESPSSYSRKKNYFSGEDLMMDVHAFGKLA